MNGWKNWETWLFALHFMDHLHDRVPELHEDGEFRNATDLEDWLKEFLDDYLHETVGTGDTFVNDIMNGFTGDVDYREIAQHLIEDGELTF